MAAKRWKARDTPNSIGPLNHSQEMGIRDAWIVHPDFFAIRPLTN
jgi:hypothetical protein